MRWILEDEEDTQGLIRALKETCTPHARVEIRPFTHELIGRGLANIPNGERVFVRGPFGLPEACAARGWDPVVWTGPELSEISVQQAFGAHYLNADGWSSTLRSLTPSLLETKFGGHEKIFIKPAEDTKTFSGQLVRIGSLEDWANSMIQSGYASPELVDEAVFVSAPQQLGCEWRAFVVDGHVVTASCYKQYGRVMPEVWLPDGLPEFLETCVNLYDPLPGYALDVTQVEDGSFRVLEMNTLNHAGLYACDPLAIVKAVNAVLDRPDLSPAP